MITNERFDRIDQAYKATLGDRDPGTVSVVDLLPAIFDAVPDTSLEEIADALCWVGDRAEREADAFRRYRNAKYGNVGKTAQPGDGTLPFPPKTRQ